MKNNNKTDLKNPDTKLYTKEKVEVTQRIKSGLTVLVLDKKEAEKLTCRIGYFYEVFDADGDFYGYGIPK